MKKETNPTDQLLWSTEEIAKKTGLSTRTLEGYRFDGIGPKFILVSSRCIRYRLEDVRLWIEQSQKPASYYKKNRTKRV